MPELLLVAASAFVDELLLLAAASAFVDELLLVAASAFVDELLLEPVLPLLLAELDELVDASGTAVELELQARNPADPARQATSPRVTFFIRRCLSLRRRTTRQASRL